MNKIFNNLLKIDYNKYSKDELYKIIDIIHKLKKQIKSSIKTDEPDEPNESEEKRKLLWNTECRVFSDRPGADLLLYPVSTPRSPGRPGGVGSEIRP